MIGAKVDGLDTLGPELRPGAEIEIHSARLLGVDYWCRYTIVDWEQPRIGPDGRALFSARYHGSGEVCPMIVAPERIRLWGTQASAQ
jgi:hypothetical protein